MMYVFLRPGYFFSAGLAACRQLNHQITLSHTHPCSCGAAGQRLLHLADHSLNNTTRRQGQCWSGHSDRGGGGDHSGSCASFRRWWIQQEPLYGRDQVLVFRQWRCFPAKMQQRGSRGQCEYLQVHYVLDCAQVCNVHIVKVKTLWSWCHVESDLTLAERESMECKENNLCFQSPLQYLQATSLAWSSQNHCFC